MGEIRPRVQGNEETVEDITAYRVVDRIDPQPIGQFEDCRAKAVLPVVVKVGASISCGFSLSSAPAVAITVAPRIFPISIGASPPPPAPP